MVCAALERYLDACEPYDEIRLMLFAHGVDSIGLAPIGRWRGLLARARAHGRFVGVDEKAYPADFATFARIIRPCARSAGASRCRPR